MQTKLSYFQYDCFETIGNDTVECPIDIEYSLPDYCPDIQKILKCIPYTNITSYSFTQDKLMCEGKLILHVEYMDGKSGSIRVCDIQKEFSHAGDITPDEARTFGKLSASVGHMICRAISARKLDIHVPVLLHMNIFAHRENKINCDAQDLEKRTEKVLLSHAVTGFTQTFTLEQELELSQSSAPIDCILRRDVSINSVQSSASNEKIIIEGIADINIVYRSFSENASVEKMEYSIPFVETFDAGDLDADCAINCDINICDFSIQAKEDVSGEYTLCDMYLKASACIMVYKDKEIDLIVDAYSTKNKCKMKYENLNVSHLQERYSEKININKSIFLSEDEIEKVLDYWCEEVAITPYCEKNKINYRGKFNICLIYKGKSGQLFSLTKNFDYTTTRDFGSSCQRKCEASLKMAIKDFRIIDGNNIEFNCEAILVSNDFECYSKKMLYGAEYSDDKEEKIDKNCLKVYYSHNGEDLWDIGKAYNVAVSDIIENNKLVDTEKSNGIPLLIY